jgi:hypothetical protein
MITVISFYFVLLLLPSTVVAIVQNVTINSTGLGIEYIPQSAWTVSTDSHATGGSSVQSGAENATVIFNVTSELNFIFLRQLGANVAIPISSSFYNVVLAWLQATDSSSLFDMYRLFEPRGVGKRCYHPIRLSI